MRKFYMKIHLFALSIISQHRDAASSLKLSPMEGRDPFTSFSQYHGCRCPGAWQRQGICSHGIDLVLPKYSILSTRRAEFPDSKVHGANMGPTWVLSAPDGPHVSPMNLAIREHSVHWDASNELIILAVVSTHWGRVMHICIGKLIIIGSDNGLSPDQQMPEYC